MADRRYKELGTGTFFGGLLYERAVPQGHFLRELDRAVEWSVFTDRLVELYRGLWDCGQRGAKRSAGHNPMALLRLLSGWAPASRASGRSAVPLPAPSACASMLG
jgi:hypothetical protein